MSLIEAIILGIVQGLTEFLPVSSSGHIELVKAIFGTELEEGLLFTIVLHFATALSTLVVFRKEIIQLFKGIFSKEFNQDKRYALWIVASMIPAALVGFVLDDFIEGFFKGRIAFVGVMLLVTGVLLYLSDRVKHNVNKEMSLKSAVVMGLVQAIAILPGISRSGSTIVTGVFMGVDRAKAARFSFIMVLPLIVGAMLKKVLDASDAGVDLTEGFGVLAAGFLMAFVSGLLAIRWMIKLVERSQLTWFAIYCFVVGAVALFYSLA